MFRSWAASADLPSAVAWVRIRWPFSCVGSVFRPLPLWKQGVPSQSPGAPPVRKDMGSNPTAFKRSGLNASASSGGRRLEGSALSYSASACPHLQEGTWCSGTTSAYHAESTVRNPQCVHWLAGLSFLAKGCV